MFSDIRDSTSLAESQPPEETIDLLNTYYTLMFDAISGHGGIVTMMAGDGLMAVFGAPMTLPDHGGKTARAALGTKQADRPLKPGPDAPVTPRERRRTQTAPPRARAGA